MRKAVVCLSLFFFSTQLWASSSSGGPSVGRTVVATLFGAMVLGSGMAPAQAHNFSSNESSNATWGSAVFLPRIGFGTHHCAYHAVDGTVPVVAAINSTNHRACHTDDAFHVGHEHGLDSASTGCEPGDVHGYVFAPDRDGEAACEATSSWFPVAEQVDPMTRRDYCGDGSRYAHGYDLGQTYAGCHAYATASDPLGELLNGVFGWLFR